MAKTELINDVANLDVQMGLEGVEALVLAEYQREYDRQEAELKQRLKAATDAREKQEARLKEIERTTAERKYTKMLNGVRDAMRSIISDADRTIVLGHSRSTDGTLSVTLYYVPDGVTRHVLFELPAVPLPKRWADVKGEAQTAAENEDVLRRALTELKRVFSNEHSRICTEVRAMMAGQWLAARGTDGKQLAGRLQQLAVALGDRLRSSVQTALPGSTTSSQRRKIAK